MKSFGAMLAILAVLGLACPSYGTTITADGVLQFYDNFEGVSAGNTPDNGSYPGSWEVDQYGGSVTVITGEPAEGAQYLRYDRTGGGDTRAIANLANRQTGGEAIHVEWMMYVPMSSSYQANIHLQDSDGATRTALLVGRNGAGNIEYLTTPSAPAWSLASLTYTADKWQKWMIDYTVGALSFTFSVDGSSETVSAFGSGEVGRFVFNGNPDGGAYYIDAVPEPATSILAATGLLGLLAYAWRKRKS